MKLKNLSHRLQFKMTMNIKTIYELYLNLHTKLHNKISLIKSNFEKH